MSYGDSPVLGLFLYGLSSIFLSTMLTLAKLLGISVPCCCCSDSPLSAMFILAKLSRVPASCHCCHCSPQLSLLCSFSNSLLIALHHVAP